MTRSLQHAFTNFFNKSPVAPMFGGYANRPDRVKLSRGNDRSVVTSVYNRLALDAAAVNIRHVKTDKDGNYLEEINSELNDCLSLDTNLDQTATAFFRYPCVVEKKHQNRFVCDSYCIEAILQSHRRI